MVLLWSRRSRVRPRRLKTLKIGKLNGAPYLFRRRTVAAIVLLAFIPAATKIPALAALGLVSAVCAAVVVYEALRWREQRLRLRDPEPAG